MNEFKNGNIALEKIHIEADAGKSIHDMHEHKSFVDLNRAGMPLLELVSQPVLNNIDDVGRFVQEIQRLVRFTNIGDGNMEEGSLRCDANISVRRQGELRLGQKVEIKNMNSVRHIKNALEFEFTRQAGLLEAGKKVVQESRLYNVEKGITESMREKEEAHDYRYFPDPDLAPVKLTEEELAATREQMPLLPVDYRKKFRDDYHLAPADALSLADDPDIANLLETTITKGPTLWCKATDHIPEIIVMIQNISLFSMNLMKITEMLLINKQSSLALRAGPWPS